MNEGLSLLHTTAHHSTRLIISLGVWAASRIHERDMNEYGYGRGVSGKEKSAASTAMNMSTMVYDFGTTGVMSRPVQSCARDARAGMGCTIDG